MEHDAIHVCILKCCLFPDLALKQPMHFHSPPHVPALFIYPTTQGILVLCVLYMQNLLLYIDVYIQYTIVFKMYCMHCHITL